LSISFLFKILIHVKLDDRTKTTGAVLCDQSRTLDISARNYKKNEKAPEDILLEVMEIIVGFIEIGENK
jgi:mRNA interferase MazF